ncbi:MAG: F-type H+-transporting ATPase subunit gamma [Gaiellaceae bacterium]|nr:F-type H+-transporting ATPase subunit gamma [Gaiellaceae bacterium]
MASQQDIKRRIRSVRNTRKVTKAMELVSGAKLRRAQLRIEALRPFADAMAELIGEAAGRTRIQGQPLLDQRDDPKNVAILLLTGDRGLAGGFNGSAVRRAVEEARKAEAAGMGVRWLVIGRKGAGTVRFRGFDVEQAWTGFTDRPTYQDAEAVAHRVIDLFAAREVDRVVLVYNAFRSALVQEVTADVLLPLAAPEIREKSPREIAMEGLLLFEPEADEMLATLLPTAVETAIYRALLESAASEHGARMSAMRSASDNATELIEGYTLAMNRARQAEITQAILEVVAGADALQ